MEEKLNSLKSALAEIFDLKAVTSLLGWDHQTYMPEGGARARSEQLSTLSRLAHEKFTSPGIGDLLADLESYQAGLDPDSDDFCLLRYIRHKYDKDTRIPNTWISEFTRTTALAQSVWVHAKSESNFSLFEPHLEQIVRLNQEYASFFQPYDHIYDPLLDDYEPGVKTADIKEIFNTLRKEQVSLIQQITGAAPVEEDFLHQGFDAQDQWKIGVDMITRLGFDWKRGRQDKSVHPFTSGFDIGDVRITTNINEHNIVSGLFGTIHECGHALYEQGIDLFLRRSPLGGGVSSGMHESQSRFWENLIGRSYAFWQFFYPGLQKMFNHQLAGVDLNTFYAGINAVKPSFIRIHADEATYNLHIMLRMELEIAMLNGSLAVKDLPQAWNDRMVDYLGITPPDDSMGVLQDVHWSSGSFGYFPAYALGNLAASQLWECLEKDNPLIYQDMAGGNFSSVLNWMREKIHRHGSKYLPQELLRNVTGTGFDPKPYVRYLKKKFSSIYRLVDESW